MSTPTTATTIETQKAPPRLRGRAGELDLRVPLGIALAMYASIMLVGIWRTAGEQPRRQR